MKAEDLMVCPSYKDCSITNCPHITPGHHLQQACNVVCPKKGASKHTCKPKLIWPGPPAPKGTLPRSFSLRTGLYVYQEVKIADIIHFSKNEEPEGVSRLLLSLKGGAVALGVYRTRGDRDAEFIKLKALMSGPEEGPTKEQKQHLIKAAFPLYSTFEYLEVDLVVGSYGDHLVHCEYFDGVIFQKKAFSYDHLGAILKDRKRLNALEEEVGTRWICFS